MTRAMGARIGISRQRGFWLRCFLGRLSILAALFVSVCGNAAANVCVYKTVYVRSVHGSVIDQTGATVPRAKVVVKQMEYVPLDAANPRVKLRRGGRSVIESTADEHGDFHLKVPRGEYWVDVQAAGFAPAHAYVKVGLGLRSVVRSNTLRLVLHVGEICEQQPPNEKHSQGEQS